MKKFKIAVVFGTRPEIIKLSPFIRLCADRRQPFFLVHSGQHYSHAMDGIFMRELKLPAPKYRLDGRSKGPGLHAEHLGRLMTEMEAIFIKEKPSHVVVQGDTNTVLAAALAASKLPGIRIAHVEAGLRSFDRRMPEETNRILTDHVSHDLFPPTQGCARLLRAEGIDTRKIHVTGNTIVDAVKQNLAIARQRPGKKAAASAAAPERPYALLTLHRQENVDDRATLASIVDGLGRTARATGLDILFPAHPRTLGRLQAFKIRLPSAVRVTEPVGYFGFLKLQAAADLILTDSGGVQEEACILKVPCVTLRTSTERPETVAVGGNVIAGCGAASIVRSAQKILNRPRNWRNPFGDGRASERILNILRKDRP